MKRGSFVSEYKIWGGTPLRGHVAVSGAKNGALPLLFASLIAGGACTFYRVPHIGDVHLACALLERMGAEVVWLDRDVVRVNAASTDPAGIDGSLTSRLRASSYLLGACLGRFGFCPSLETGGCDFGCRPLDCHYAMFRALGAVGEREVSAPNGLHAAHHTFSRVSVGATINALLTAARIDGISVFENCAVETHVSDLARFLTVLGARIDGLGTPRLKVHGTPRLGGGSYIVSPDDIEAGTYLLATAATGGDVILTEVSPRPLAATLQVLEQMGCDVVQTETTIRLVRHAPLQGVSVTTAPSPGFPTDLHPPLTAALCLADGRSTIFERVWENRFRYTEELRRMGATLAVSGDTLTITPTPLHPAAVTATDLRGGAALLVAALTISGCTTITGRELLERGYEFLPKKLRGLGAVVI